MHHTGPLTKLLRSEKGVALIALISLACSILIGFYMLQKSPAVQLTGNKQHLLANQFSEIIFATIREQFNKAELKPPCLGSRFQSVLDLSGNSSPEKPAQWTVDESKGNLSACNDFFIGKTKIKESSSASAKRWAFPAHLIEKYSINVEEVGVPDALLKEITLHLEITIKAMQGLKRSRKFSYRRSYMVRVMSLAHFALILRSGGLQIDVPSPGPEVHIYSPVFSTPNDDSRSLSDIYYNDPPQVFFHDVVYMRAKMIQEPRSYHHHIFQSIYRSGLITAVHKNLNPSYLPPTTRTSTIWNMPLYVRSSSLLEPTAALSPPPSGRNNNLPQIINGIDTKEETTCLRKTANISPRTLRALYIRPNQNLTLNLPEDLQPKRGTHSGDSMWRQQVLCAIFVVNTLTVNLTEATSYALLGIFAANRLIVEGPEGAKLHILNPRNHLSFPTRMQNDPALQNIDVSISHIRSIIESSSPNFARNLFVPMVRNAPPRSPLVVMAPNQIFFTNNDGNARPPPGYKHCGGEKNEKLFPYFCKNKDSIPWPHIEDARETFGSINFYRQMGEYRRRPFYLIQENF